MPGFTHDKLALIDFATNHSASIIGPFMQNALPLELQPHEGTIQAFVQSILPDAIDMLLEMWDSRMNDPESSAAEEPVQTRSLTGDGEHGVSLTPSATESPGDAPLEVEDLTAYENDPILVSEHFSRQTPLFLESNEIAPLLPDLNVIEEKDCPADGFGWFLWVESIDSNFQGR